MMNIGNDSISDFSRDSKTVSPVIDKFASNVFFLSTIFGLTTPSTSLYGAARRGACPDIWTRPHSKDVGDKKSWRKSQR